MIDGIDASGRRLRILLATAESHPTARPDVSVLFGRMLPQRGIDVDLLATTVPRRGDARDDPSGVPPWPGGHARLRPARGGLATLLVDLRQQCQLTRLCRKGYDALVVRDKPVLGVIGWLAARAAGIPYCYWMSYPLPEQYRWLARRREARLPLVRRSWMWLRGTVGAWCLDRLLVPRADWLFVQSQAMREQLRRTGSLRHERVSVVPMGVDLDALPEPAPALPASLAGCRVGVYLGTLDRNRELTVLVDATLAVVRQVPDFRLLVIGEADEPTDVGALQAYAQSVGATPLVCFTGRLPATEALALARRASLGLSPVPRNALTEVGSPTKAVEYLACGLPVVCNDQPDQAAVVTDSGNGLIAPLCAEGFASAIVSILADLDTEAGREAAARRALEAQDWVRVHRSYEVIGTAVAQQLREVAAEAHSTLASERLA